MTSPGPELRRSLGLASAVMIVVGSVIGSGIFLKPLDIARALPDVGWIYAAWAGIGLVCLLGAFAYAELGAMYPEAGGQYAFLREAYGRFPAFLFGWTLLLVINSGTLAALAAAFADNLGVLGHWGRLERDASAVAMILVLAIVNHVGVGAGAWLQNAATSAKLLALAAIVIGAGLGLRAGGDVVIGAQTILEVAPKPPDLLSGLARAAVAIFWAYEGWYQLAFNAAELKNPRRDLVRGLLIGVLILVAVYVLTNAAYLSVVPQETMRGLEPAVAVPKTAVGRLFGPAAGDILVLLVALSVFGAANPNLLSTPRGIWAMAKDGLVPRWLLRVSPRFATPVTAIWSQAAWAIVLLVVLREFKDLTDYVVFASLAFYALTVFGVLVLRRRRPDLPRPFRCPGYPLTPLAFIAAVLFVEVRTVMDPEGRTNALIGIAIVAAGAVVYALGRTGRPSRRAP